LQTFIERSCEQLDQTSSVEDLCEDLLYEEHHLYPTEDVYDENHGLPYADDLSGDEFGSYRYEQAQAYLEYMKQFDDIRTEFSVDDDVANPDNLLDEWEDPEQDDYSTLPMDVVEKQSSEEDISDSLFFKAERIFNQLQKQRLKKEYVQWFDEGQAVVCASQIKGDEPGKTDDVNQLLGICNDEVEKGKAEYEHKETHENVGLQYFHITNHKTRMT
ncbi:hypothetical protein COOONC_08741, partial [Cooperia oncophora]